jgi:hypothetical protein
MEDAIAQATRALCNQRATARNRLATAAGFKRDHPNGTADFSIMLIDRAIRTATAELKALSDVECAS